MENEKEKILKMTDHISECLPGGFFVDHADEAEELITFNSEVMKIYGCDTAEEFRTIIGNSFRDMVHPDDLALVERNISSQIQKENDTDYIEYRIICRDGSEKYVRDYGRFVHTKEYGDVYCVFIHDVTQNKLIYEREMNQYTSLIQALAIPYDNIYKVNADTGEGICYRMGSRYGQRLAAGNYEQAIHIYIENDVIIEDRYLFDRINTISGVNEMLKEKRTYYFNYRVLRNDQVQYFQCQLVKPNLQRNEFVIAFKNVDEEKNIELAAQRKVEEALAAVEKVNETLRDETDIAGALSRDYPDVVLLDLVSDTAVTIKRKGCIIPEDERAIRRSYNDTWDNYISKYVYEEDREVLKSAILVDKVKCALEQSDEYSCSYRVLFDETGIHYYQASFIRLYSRNKKESQIILGFRCVDTIVEEERKNRTIQEEQFRIIGALSQEYHSLFKIDATTGKISLYRTDGIGMESDRLGKLMESGSYEEVLSKYIDAYIVPEDRKRIRESTKLSILVEKVPEVGLYKLGYKRNMNGVISYFEMNTVKTVDQNGTVTFIMGLRDVDEEMRRQLKQTKELEMQREIIEGLGSEYYSVLLVDPDKDTVTTYRAEDEDGRAITAYFHKYHNCWSRGLQGYADELVSEASRGEFLEKLSLDQIRTDGEDYSVTYEKLTDHGIMYLQARVSFVQETSGRFVAVVGTRNVDDLIKKEREQEMALQAAYDVAEAANKAKTDFLSNMSHDIRTPMNAIIGFTKLLEKHLDDKELAKSYIKKIQTSNDLLLSLINNVLEMTRIESGKTTLDETYWDAHAFNDTLFSLFDSQMKEKGITFTRTNKVKHPDVLCDETKLREIFLNILSNALKYTPSGGKVTMNLTEIPSDRPGYAMYQTVIEDTGIGMSEEFLPHLFEEFTRERSSTESKLNGTGLGMPIVKKLVDLMQGTIEVESKVGKGTRITVTLPHRIAQESDIQNIIEKVDAYDENCFKGKRILLAEDNELNAEIAITILEEAGFEVEHAADGIICVDMMEKAEAGYYDLILMDIQMPNMDGYKATQTIRKLSDQKKAGITIVAMTANAFEEDKKVAYKAGMNWHISKPIKVDELMAALAEILKE